jgi:hypothetical protein
VPEETVKYRRLSQPGQKTSSFAQQKALASKIAACLKQTKPDIAREFFFSFPF